MTTPENRFLDHPSPDENNAHPPTEIMTIRPEINIQTRQQIPYFVGISASTVGAKGISMNLIMIPPGHR